MSFILDALKKSESERQRQSPTEGLYVPSAPSSAPTSRWLWVVGALLLVNAIVLTVVLLRSNSPAPAQSTASVINEQKQVAASPIASLEQQTDRQTISDDNAYAETSEQLTSFKERVDVAKDKYAEPEPAPAAEKTSSTATEFVLSNNRNDTANTNSEKISAAWFKTFNEVRAGGMDLPDLDLELHVFSDAPASRFVFVNKSKYKERATLTEGPLVKEIVPEGVVLEYRGTQFLLPRE